MVDEALRVTYMRSLAARRYLCVDGAWNKIMKLFFLNDEISRGNLDLGIGESLDETEKLGRGRIKRRD